MKPRDRDAAPLARFRLGDLTPSSAVAVATTLFSLTVTACSDSAPVSDHAHIAESEIRKVADGDVARGRSLIADIGCAVCHTIPGIPGAHGIVGPPLNKFAQRSLIAGVIPNRPATLVVWVRDAPSLVPQTGMPSLPLTDEQARHVAAFLYTLR